MEDLNIKCDRVRACKWKGLESELVKKFNARETKKDGVETYDLVCPQCGCKTMQEIREE